MKRATITTTHSRPERIAAAIRPDNTAEMSTTMTNDGVTTTIERDTLGGLQTSLDDLLVNLTVADRLATDAQTENMTTTDQSSIHQ